MYISPCHSLTWSQLTLPPPRVLKSILYVFIPVLPLLPIVFVIKFSAQRPTLSYCSTIVQPHKIICCFLLLLCLLSILLHLPLPLLASLSFLEPAGGFLLIDEGSVQVFFLPEAFLDHPLPHTQHIYVTLLSRVTHICVL